MSLGMRNNIIVRFDNMKHTLYCAAVLFNSNLKHDEISNLGREKHCH